MFKSRYVWWRKKKFFPTSIQEFFLKFIVLELIYYKHKIFFGLII